MLADAYDDVVPSDAPATDPLAGSDAAEEAPDNEAVGSTEEVAEATTDEVDDAAAASTDGEAETEPDGQPAEG